MTPVGTSTTSNSKGASEPVSWVLWPEGSHNLPYFHWQGNFDRFLLFFRLIDFFSGVLISLAELIDLPSFTRGSNPQVLKDGFYASNAVLDIDVLKGVAPGGSPKSMKSTNVEDETLPLRLRTSRPL